MPRFLAAASQPPKILTRCLLVSAHSFPAIKYQSNIFHFNGLISGPWRAFGFASLTFTADNFKEAPAHTPAIVFEQFAGCEHVWKKAVILI